MAPPVHSSARRDAHALLGQKLIFKSGISVSVEVGSIAQSVQSNARSAELLAGLDAWARVYRYVEDGHYIYHILSVTGESDDIRILRTDLRQPPPRSRRSPPEPAAIEYVGELNLDQAGEWLLALSSKLAHHPSASLILQQPKLPRPKQPRVAVVGNPNVDGMRVSEMAFAAGKVAGAEIIFIRATTFRETYARLSENLPLHGAILVTAGNPHLSLDVMPDAIADELLMECIETKAASLLSELRAALDMVLEQIDNARPCEPGERAVLLNIMLRGMLSHAKIGQYMHCSEETLLTGIRARRLNLRAARELLRQNSEQFLETKESDMYFLWKAHHEGDEYFLNPKKVPDIKALLGIET